MNNTIDLLIKKTTIRDVEIALLDAKLKGFIIPEKVFEILKKVENSYALPNEVINELTEHGND